MYIGRLALAVTMLGLATHAVAEYREIEIKDGGKIVGTVKVVGELPVLPPQPVFKQREICGNELPDERLVVGPGGVLKNAIVQLTDIKAGKATPLAQPVLLDNKHCTFVPHALTATLGQTLDIHNSDPFLHDAHGVLGAATLFNVAIMKDRTVHQSLTEPGLIHINCNIRHTWMHAYLLVSEHPYHAVTDANGQFVIDNVPPGAWTVRVWHELLGSVDRTVRLEPNATDNPEIVLHAVAAPPE